MKWAWRIGKLAGIQIKIHATFILILLWVGVAHWAAERHWTAVLAGISFVLGIFACVVLHELGHALVAQKYGIKTRDITLLPIGGLARLERMPDDPRQEIWVALAGPFVNIVIAVALFLGTHLLSPWEPISNLSLTQGSMLERLMVVNLVLVLFNLLPAFPMDGGRVLRGLLATRLNYAHATRIAARLGQTMAVVFGILSFYGNPILLFIALFVWIGAAQEMRVADIRSALGGVPVERAMLTEYVTVSPDDPLSRVVDLILAGSQEDFPVVENGRVVGVITRQDLVSGLAKQGQEGHVGDVMQREFAVVDASEMLENVFPRLQSAACRIVPVTRLGALVGLITLENVGEFVMIKSALTDARRAA